VTGSFGDFSPGTRPWLSGVAKRAPVAALSVVATALVVSPAQAQVSRAPATPVATIPAPAAMRAACASGPATSCEQAGLQAINAARAAEGVPPLVLPANFSSLQPIVQLLVVTDLERTGRGLPGFTGLSVELDNLALEGALAHKDPVGPPNTSWGSNWAGGEGAVLEADYDWMYNDGPGSYNVDCPASGGEGCWGHRDNILGNYGPSPSMGAAIARAQDGGTPYLSMTQLFASAPAGAIAYKLPALASLK